MATNAWLTMNLAELCDSIDYGYTASASSNPIGPKFLRITDIVGGYINWNTVPFCDIEPTLEEKYRLHHGDIVIARTGAPTGVSAHISQPPRAIFASYLVRLKIGSRTDSRFISYFLKSSSFWEYIHGVLGDKSAQPNASARTMTQVSVLLPSLPEQRAIAHILGTLDDKIELNRQMNRTLEAMAQALFKSWFVDFEPFRGQGMQDSPLGEIPVGWGVETLSQICEVKMGQSPPGDTYNEMEEGISFYQGIKDFGSRFPQPRVYCTMPTRFAEPYDVLLSVRAPVGSLNVANERCAIGRGLAALCSKERRHSYLYYLLRNVKTRWDTFNSEGTVFGCITKKDIVDIKIIIPPTAIVERFESVASMMDQLITNNAQETSTLSDIRDPLLPKLLSGEIRVKDTEKFVE